MPLMSECRSTLFSVSNSKSFPFTLPDTHQSLATGNDQGSWKDVYFCCNGGDSGLGISNSYDGNKYAYSYANEEGYQVNVDSQGTNILTGQTEDGVVGRVSLKMLEVFEVECINPPKQPEIPEPE